MLWSLSAKFQRQPLFSYTFDLLSFPRFDLSICFRWTNYVELGFVGQGRHLCGPLVFKFSGQSPSFRASVFVPWTRGLSVLGFLLSYLASLFIHIIFFFFLWDVFRFLACWIKLCLFFAMVSRWMVSTIQFFHFLIIGSYSIYVVHGTRQSH